MNMHIKQIMDHSVNLFREKIESSSGNQNKIVIVALIALGCLAAYLYYSMVCNPKSSISDKKITPQANAPKADKAAPKKDSQNEAKAHPLKKATKKAEPAADDILTDDDDKILESESQAEAPEAKKGNAAKKAAPASGRTQRAHNPASGRMGDLNPLMQEAADIEKATLLSLQDQPPENDADDADAAFLAAAIKASKEEAANKGYLPVESGNDDDLEKILEQSKKEAKEKEDRELEEARKLSLNQGAVNKPPVKDTQKIAAAPKKPPEPTPKKAETPKTPKKAETPVDKALLDTAKANSDKSADTLDIAVQNAQEKLKGITGHEIKRNEVGGAYLVLKFSSEVKRNMAVEQLRNPPYSMFQTKEPSRDVGTTELELDVEQTIDFQNKF